MKQILRPAPIATFIFVVIVIYGISFPQVAHAASAEEINIGADATLRRFRKEIGGGQQFSEGRKRCFDFSHRHQGWYRDRW